MQKSNVLDEYVLKMGLDIKNETLGAKYEKFCHTGKVLFFFDRFLNNETQLRFPLRKVWTQFQNYSTTMYTMGIFEFLCIMRIFEL